MQNQGLRLSIKQKTACYRIPTTSGGVWLSYPLPPYSTIYGFLRAICNQKEETDQSINYRNTYLSISGKYETTYFDLQTMHKTVNTEPYRIQTLYNVDLIIYIVTDELRLNLIRDALKNPPFSLSLGRKEDLITQIKVDPTQIIYNEIDLDKIDGNYDSFPALIPIDIGISLGLTGGTGEPKGILFNLPEDSYFLREFNLRRMQYKKVLYVTDNSYTFVGGKKVHFDSCTNKIIWLNSQQ